MKNRVAGLLAAVALLIGGLTGCDLAGDVIGQLSPPKLTGEQQKVQQALDAYLAQEGKTGGRLKYPKRGNYRAAILLLDFDGDGTDEAIAFYTADAAETVRLHLMRRDGGKDWVTAADIEGRSAEIDEIGLTDLDGDGAKELLVGWQLYSGKEKQLSVYTATEEGGIAPVGGELLYTELFIGGLTAPGEENLLVLRADTAASEVTVSLEILEDGILMPQSTAHLDGYVQEFTGIQLSTVGMSETGARVPALYVDGNKGGLRITELVVWDGERLVAPLYNTNNNASEAAVREIPLGAADMDGDGILEVPSCRRLPGYETAPANASQWITRWSKWTLTETMAVEETPAFYCVMNMNDGYYFRLDKPFLTVEEPEGGEEPPTAAEPTPNVTAQYDAIMREWSLYRLKDGRRDALLMTVRAAAIDEDGLPAPLPEGDTRTFTEAARSGSRKLVYEVYITEEGQAYDRRRMIYNITAL